LQEEALVVLLRSYYARLGVALYYHGIVLNIIVIASSN
jgi:hypothetical protein